MTFAVSLSRRLSAPASVMVSIEPGTAVAGRRHAGSVVPTDADFVGLTSTSKTVRFAVAAMSGLTPIQRTVSVPVVGDLGNEADEVFTVRLSQPGGVLLGRATGTGTIINDD